MLRPSVIRWSLRALLAIVVIYAIYLTGLFFLQERAIFPGAYFKDKEKYAHAAPPVGVQQVWITTPEGFRVEAWYQPGNGRTAANPGPAVIFFHGNIDVIDERWNVAQLYVDAGISAMLVEYRGFGRAGGKPSQAGIVADATQFYQWLRARPEVEADRVILHGISLGGAVAVQVAAQFRPAALIIESTFVSMKEMTNRYGGFGGLCRHQFRTDLELPKLNIPILIFHGTRDTVIPIDHARRLHAMAPTSTLIERDCDHHNYTTDWPAIVRFLQENKLGESK